MLEEYRYMDRLVNRYLWAVAKLAALIDQQGERSH